MQAVRHTIKRLIHIAAISAAVAAMVMAAMFAFNAIVFSQGQAGVKAALQRAIDDGTINMTGRVTPWSLLPLGRKSGLPLFVHDCLIWSTLIVPGMDTRTLSLRTVRLEAAKTEIDQRAPSNPDCQAVLQVLTGPPQTQPEPIAYDRYIIGQRGVAQLLLSNLSLNVSSVIVHSTVYAAFILALALAWRRRATAVVVMCASLLLFYGLSYYGGMLFFAPMDITHALFIIAALFVPLGAASMAVCAMFGALYAAFIAQFEILTGGIPVALAVIALLVGNGAPDQRAFVRNTSVVVAAFCATLVLCFAIKLSIASLIEGSNLFAYHAPALFRRLNGNISPETSPAVLQLFAEYAQYPFGQVAYLIRLYYSWSRIIGWGSPIFGSILVIAGVIALVFATVRTASLRRHADLRLSPQLLGCWLALGFLIAWIATFWNHTLVHPFFMARFLVIPVMCGAVALVALREDVSRPGPALATTS